MSKTTIPAATRRDLWVAAGGRCEFRGCNKTIDKNFLTGERVKLGEFCHIIADSPSGPRGDAVDSPRLATDPNNLIVCCTGCHKVIDDGDLKAQYSAHLLRQMKEEHERHISAIYDARVERKSLPLVVTASINGTPSSISAELARASVLVKTSYTRFPSYDFERIDLGHSPRESEPTFYRQNAEQIQDAIENLLRRVTRDHLEHIDIFAIAHIPFLVQIGYVLGDRVPCTVHQAQRNQTNPWLWPSKEQATQVFFHYELPDNLTTDDLAMAVSLSGNITFEEVSAYIPGAPFAHFYANEPGTQIVDSEEVVTSFRKKWLEMLTKIHEMRPTTRIHLFAAAPNSLAIEMGRAIHPHASPSITIWNKVNSQFTKALDLPFQRQNRQ